MTMIYVLGLEMYKTRYGLYISAFYKTVNKKMSWNFCIILLSSTLLHINSTIYIFLSIQLLPVTIAHNLSSGGTNNLM